MIIQYDIVVTILNIIDNSTSKFKKTFDSEIKAATDALLYNNYHILSEGVYILDMFEDEVDAYCKSMGIERSSIEVDEFEIVSLSNNSEVFFESDSEDNSLSLKPTIKCYVHPKNAVLQEPTLIGTAYDSTTIIWTWPNDEQYAHYLVEEAINPENENDKGKIIAQLPIGATSYTETGLEPDTPYTRRLINYTDEQTSTPSASVTVMTETVEASQSLEEYSIPKNYDFTTQDSEREIIEENLEAFHSGIGDNNDLKVYKQMDADFYQKFKAYFEITGRRFQREKRYDQVGFNYKICLEATEEVREQEGEVTFEVDVYPREWVTIEDYMWATAPVEVAARMTATVFLRKPVEKKDTEEVVIYKPKRKEVTVPKVTLHDASLILSLDCSTSQRKPVGSQTRRDIMVKAAKLLIDKFEAIAANQLEYVIVGWAGNTHVKKFAPGQAAQAKASLDTIVCANNVAKYDGVSVLGSDATDFKKGLTAGHSYCTYQKVGQIFFTDGFCNMNSGTRAYGRPYPGNSSGSFSNANCNNVLTSITEGFNGAGAKTVVVFGAAWDVQDPDLSGWTGNKKKSNLNFQKEVFNTVKNNSSSNKFKVIQGDIDNGNAEALANQLAEGINLFDVEYVFDHYEFEGWEEQPEDTSIVNKYDIDDIKMVTVTSDIYTYTFDKTKTPVVYSRDEKRAIIPVSSFISDVKMSDKSIYDIIMEKVKQTSEWNDGYNQTIGTVEANGESDKFLIKGLHIEDTYNFGDEDKINEDNWGENTWEDGLEGTVNTYTDIDKAGTTTYGDDCYLVSQNNYLMIQGYTDAIIYDGTRFVTTELNYYDHSSEILISAAGIYNSFLHNRKKESLTYSGSDKLQHVVDLIERGKDIFFTGYEGLMKEGDWINIGELTNDLVAHNETMYQSPVLNYRFNLEDPDAKTPLYEILPDCDPDSNYLHIVLLHVYYAKNVWITNKNNYVELWPIPEGSPIAYYGDPCIPLVENIYQWTLKEHINGTGKDNGWYIDNYLWFMAKPMFKIQDYYDELPGPGMETFYGLVNGRYSSSNVNGKKDLTVDAPQFNIPTTVTDKHKDSIRIYAVITEFYPDTALVSYKWEHPWNHKDGITQVNGDYIYFSSDSLVYKDIEYLDVISTINMENQEVHDNKTQEKIFEIQKPQTIYDYQNYYLEVHTDNSDVLALKYPTEIEFDENDITQVGVAFKGVVNATSKWSPRIHNGYYYLNQHEYFAYSEFDVEANFETYEEEIFKTQVGYISFDVQLRHIASPKEIYTVVKDTRSELLQDEEHFQWINNSGLTLKPVINGEYYREYDATMYVSPVILFEHALTLAGPLTVEYEFADGFNYLPMEIRYYDIENCKWSEWEYFENGTVPPVLSSAYQVRFIMQASVTNEDLFLEDYMCCYLDWKDDMNEANTTNIVTITDHMTTGPYDAEGIYVSKVIDFGCESELALDLFESNYNNHIKLYIAYSDRPDSLLLENIKWVDITTSNDTYFKSRYFRYKVVIPSGEKMYWLHKRIKTLETHEMLPYLKSISMGGEYQPTDIVENFINTESFEIPKDGEPHVIFNRVLDVIGADVLEKGYTEQEIEYVKIQCITNDVVIDFNKGINTRYPSTAALSSPITAMSNIDLDIITKNTPYIYVEKEDEEYDVIRIIGTPQQYCPIVVEDPNGNTYSELKGDSFIIDEIFNTTEQTKYVQIQNNGYDQNNFHVYLDNEEMDIMSFNVTNHLVIFNDFIPEGHEIKISYCILYSFIAKIDRVNNTTTIYLHTGEGIDMPTKCKVYFETGTKNNKFIANDLSLNPIYRTDYKGFIYLTDEHNEPYTLNIYANPLRIKAGGYDKLDISIEVLDIQGNPIISKDVAVDCDYGILNCESYVTDMNGVIHIVYESAYKACTDTLTAKVLKDDGSLIKQSISIINE